MLGMAFAQITFRVNLRDTDACLALDVATAHQLGFGGGGMCSNIADVSNRCDWRLYFQLVRAFIPTAQADPLILKKNLS